MAMKATLRPTTIREVIENFVDNHEEGVRGLNGALNIRPKYQREFVYDALKQKKVMDTIYKGLPLNTFYWALNDDGTYEVLDGQQRIMSFCRCITESIALDVYGGRLVGFDGLTEAEKDAILDYELTVYICEGTDKDKLEWFKTINIAGEPLTEQELRNAVYTGEWLTHAKTLFSKQNGWVTTITDNKYLSGAQNRQIWLETALKWVADRDNIDIREYMAKHQQDKNADDLMVYFKNVIDWVDTLFTVYRKEMKGLPWGIYYNKYHKNTYSPSEIEQRTKELIDDDEVQNTRGIYEYLLSGDEKHLNLRTFDSKLKRKVYERQEGLCAKCKEKFDFEDMEGDHIIPWSQGGKTTEENLQMLCKSCNGRKSNK